MSALKHQPVIVDHAPLADKLLSFRSILNKLRMKLPVLIAEHSCDLLCCILHKITSLFEQDGLQVLQLQLEVLFDLPELVAHELLHLLF